MHTDLFFYAVAIPAVVLAGLAKGGFSGVGQVSVPLLALAVSPVQAAAILLPILLVQDAVGVWAFRHNWDAHVLKVMLPGAAVGILAGYVLAAWVSVTAVLGTLGAISILFALYQLWGRRAARALAAPTPSSASTGFALGIASGFTSQIAHAGLPPFQMWVLRKKLSPASYIGTAALYFAIVNWVKVPAYAALGQFTHENLLTALTLMPVAIASTFAGVWLVRRVPAEGFYTVIYLLMIGVGCELVWQALNIG
ncbi:MAG: sulfite exporter TauE/SafE family protein [Pseudomonadota bacterium]